MHNIQEHYLFKGQDHFSQEEELRETGLFSLKDEKAWGNFINV